MASKKTKLNQDILEKASPMLTQKAVKLALQGDTGIMKLCLEQDRPIKISLPEIKTTADIPPALNVILCAVTNGEITPNEAKTLTDMLDNYRKALETTDLELRISDLEKKYEATAGSQGSRYSKSWG